MNTKIMKTRYLYSMKTDLKGHKMLHKVNFLSNCMIAIHIIKAQSLSF